MSEPDKIFIDGDGNYDKESFGYSFVEPYIKASLVKELLDAIDHLVITDNPALMFSIQAKLNEVMKDE